MLNAVGTIAEYNPFHNGHQYQLNKAKKITNADVNIVVMSGNWVQRGDPAILDKWTRTQFALNHGADLVIELPVQFAIQPVNIFAAGGISTLKSINCDYFSFGCEHPDLNFRQLSQVNLENMKTQFHNYSKSYPELFQDAFFKKTGEYIHDSNDILGINYSKYNYQSEHPMKMIPIQRIGSCHRDLNIKNHQFASSSAIRKILLDDTEDNSILNEVVSNDIIKVCNKNNLVNWNDFWIMLRFELITKSYNELHNIYQMNEGIEHRLKKAAISSDNFDKFIDKIKTKRYTYSRLKRLFVYILFHWQKNDQFKSNYVRILGFNKIGRKYLNQEKRNIKVPIISKASQKLLNLDLKYDFKAGMIYEIINKHYQDLYRHPIIMK